MTENSELTGVQKLGLEMEEEELTHLKERDLEKHMRRAAGTLVVIQLRLACEETNGDLAVHGEVKDSCGIGLRMAKQGFVHGPSESEPKPVGEEPKLIFF